MIDDDRVLELFAAANPVPSLDLLVEDESANEDATADSEGRAAMIVTKTREQQSTKPRRPLIAAIAAAVLVGIVAVPMLVTEDQPDEATASSAAIAESFVDALEALDGDSAEALISDEAAAIYLSTFGYGAEQPGTVEGLWEWAAIYDTTYTSDGCRASDNIGDSPPASPLIGSGEFFTCDYQIENDWTRAVEQSPMTGRFRMEVADGQIVWLVDDYPFDQFEATWSMVVDWVLAEHPDDFATMFLDRASSASLTPESLDLWRQYTPEITASLSG